MSKWLEKWYSSQFEKIDELPSSKVWENISQSLEEWPKHWYESNTSDLKTEPRPSTWESIQSQIVNINYPVNRTRPAYILISLATVFLSLIPVSTSDGNLDSERSEDFLLANLHSNSPIDDFDAKNNQASKKLSNKQRTASSLNKDLRVKEKNFLKTKKQQNSNIGLASTETVQNIPNNIKAPILRKPHLVIDSVFENSFDIASLPPSLIRYPEISLRDKFVYSPKDIFKPSYSLGLHITPQFSSHLNPLRTKITANENAEVLNPLTVGFDLSFEKYISSKNSFRVNLRGNNVKSLKFKEENISKEMTMNYLSLDLTYSRKWPLGHTDKLYLKTNLGIFAGYAVSKGVNYNEERVAYIEDGLRNMDFGNSVGLILSRELSKQMRVEVGAISQFGIINIFKGTDVLPSNYFRSSTISYGLSIGVIKEF